MYLKENFTKRINWRIMELNNQLKKVRIAANTKKKKGEQQTKNLKKGAGITSRKEKNTNELEEINIKRRERQYLII